MTYICERSLLHKDETQNIVRCITLIAVGDNNQIYPPSVKVTWQRLFIPRYS